MVGEGNDSGGGVGGGGGGCGVGSGGSINGLDEPAPNRISGMGDGTHRLRHCETGASVDERILNLGVRLSPVRAWRFPQNGERLASDSHPYPYPPPPTHSHALRRTSTHFESRSTLPSDFLYCLRYYYCSIMLCDGIRHAALCARLSVPENAIPSVSSWKAIVCSSRHLDVLQSRQLMCAPSQRGCACFACSFLASLTALARAQ